MKGYVDGFVLPLAKDRIDEYEEVARQASTIFKEHGALEYWECVGDDLEAEWCRSFLETAGAGENETVVFAWVVYESKEARDHANEKIMADPRMAELMEKDDPVVDCPRMSQGGFRVLVGE